MVKLADDLGVLDDTLILFVTNQTGGDHVMHAPMPCFWAGSAGGRVVTGRYLDPGTTVGVNDVYTSVLRMAGMTIDKF